MKALLTSCGRPDILKETLESFYDFPEHEKVCIDLHEDSNPIVNPQVKEMFLHRKKGPYLKGGGVTVIRTGGVGQHESIEIFLNNWTHNQAEQDPYYVHLEDDWLFTTSYDWIAVSIRIMQADPTVIKVLAREGSPHPCTHDKVLHGTRIMADNFSDNDSIRFGYIQPWENNGIKWHGFSWNPGVTRMDLLKKFTPFPKWEQDLAKEIYDAGYKVVELAVPAYRHIGEGRSTHE